MVNTIDHFPHTNSEGKIIKYTVMLNGVHLDYNSWKKCTKLRFDKVSGMLIFRNRHDLKIATTARFFVYPENELQKGE